MIMAFILFCVIVWIFGSALYDWLGYNYIEKLDVYDAYVERRLRKYYGKKSE